MSWDWFYTGNRLQEVEPHQILQYQTARNLTLDQIIRKHAHLYQVRTRIYLNEVGQKQVSRTNQNEKNNRTADRYSYSEAEVGRIQVRYV